jgi:beta-mannosidase
MVGRTSLDGTWLLKGTDGRRGEISSYCVEDVDERSFIEAQVPGEVHLDLVRQGRIADPRTGTNALDARWVEEQYWIYRRTFEPPAEALQARRVWLVFNELDLMAEIYVNDTRVGSHANTFYPCRIDITGMLRSGQNQVSVAIESGLYAAGERPASGYTPGNADSLLHKRMWLRKPQYQFGWDWNPRLVNVGISGSVYLEWTDTARIDQLTVYPVLSEDHSAATIVTRIHIENVLETSLEATLQVHMSGPGSASRRMQVTLPPDISTQEVSLSIQQPALWWPRPYGEQPLYDVSAQLVIESSPVDDRSCRTGIRSISIDRSPHPVKGEYFCLVVNGQRIFAKGGNWVPADMLMADVDHDRYRKLVDEALVANFNTLRVWGGGRYLDYDLLSLCDEAGLLVWHDCIFACAQYPASDPAFLNSVRSEIRYVARELSPHPSLAVWCGNNEIEWGAWSWGYDTIHAHPDYALYHMEIPRILGAEDPSRPYWPSSPYSPDHRHPNDATVGDQHPWHVSLFGDLENFWAYRDDVSRFPNEGGALGASSIATLEQFLPETERYYLSPSWDYHDNELACGPNPRAADAPGRKSINEEWFRAWLGIQPAEMSLPDYAYYSGALQAEALVEYINNYRRRMFSTASAIFWMYNDSWPVTHGWTIVDYYYRRKLAFHPVRRAFEPVQIVPAIDGEHVSIYGVNDLPVPWKGTVRYGLFCFDGEKGREDEISAEFAPNASTLVAQFPLEDWRCEGVARAGAFAALWEQGVCIRQNRLLLARYKDVQWTPPEIRVTRRGDRAVFSSPAFVWGVCLDPSGEQGLADDVFDLLPGIEWTVPWDVARELPRVAYTGNAGASR